MCARVPVYILMAVTLVSGCASQQAPSGMSSTQGTTVVQTAQVTNVRDVTVYDRRSSGIGSMVGAVFGGVAGSAFGSGDGKAIATIAGAVGGSLAGQHVEQTNASRSSTELTVRFANNEVQTFQVEPGETFRIGDTVKVVTNNGISRVAH